MSRDQRIAVSSDELSRLEEIEEKMDLEELPHGKFLMHLIDYFEEHGEEELV